MQANNAVRAEQFFRELLDSTESFGDLLNAYGPDVLIDLIYLQGALLTGSYIDAHEDAPILAVLRTLPNFATWVTCVRIIE